MAFVSPTFRDHVTMEWLVDVTRAFFIDAPSLPKPGDLVSYKRKWVGVVAGILLLEQDYRYVVEWNDVKGAEHVACVRLADIVLLDRGEDQ